MPDDDDNLEVSVSPDDFYTDYECYGAMQLPHMEASCRTLLNHMDTDRDITHFGPSSSPDAEVHLPYKIVSRMCWSCRGRMTILADRNKGDGRCALSITGTGDTDESTWWNIWDTGVKLASVCARQGKQGREAGLGMLNSEMRIEMVSNA